jgi:hypothetical protein
VLTSSNFHLQMSESSETDSSNHGCDSDGELTEPSTYGSEVQESPGQQDCRKRPRQIPIQGNSWVLITQMTADSDWLTAGSKGDVENEERTAKKCPPAESIWFPVSNFI